MRQTKSHSAMLVPLLMLVTILSGCATKSPTPQAVCPPLPAPPSVLTQQPSQPYSQNVSDSLKRWQKMLMDTPLIQER